MRITSGEYGGRILRAPKGMDVRPTSDKVRQAVFNILYSMGLPEGAVVLDAFCGTGALGLEALSRGAVTCTFLDKALSSLQCCQDNIAAFKAEERSRVIQTDALRPGRIPGGVQAAGLFFLDPPYRKALLPPALQALAVNGWLAPAAAGVLESEKNATDGLPPGFDILDRRSYGDTDVWFVRYNPVPE